MDQSNCAGDQYSVATRDQLAAALALIELDGIALRIVICPPDVSTTHIPSIIASASVDAIVTDGVGLGDGQFDAQFISCSSKTQPMLNNRGGDCRTEWILLTSGTTGLPKLVLHTLSSLSGPIGDPTRATRGVVWGTFYDIRRYGGLQIFLRALLGRGSLVLAGEDETIGDFLIRLGARGVTHISGTPSHWRRTLMSPSASAIAPQYIRLSGEIADQSILDQLQNFYRGASIAHAFATTEAGVAFDVRDGLAGFPAGLVGHHSSEVEMKVVDGSLRIRSARAADRYLASDQMAIADLEGFVDTGDMLDLRDGRYFFVGRRDGVINVGGLKVHPEEVEAVINGHPDVLVSRVKAQKNPITGTIVAADVVLKSELACGGASKEANALKAEIVEACLRSLDIHKVPAVIRLVPFLSLTAAGKLTRAGH